MHTAFTARNVAKYVVKAAIHGKVQQLTADAIVDYTRFEEDDKVVDISSHVVGWAVSDRLKPYTDKMVDKTADKIADVRAKRAAKKDTAEK